MWCRVRNAQNNAVIGPEKHMREACVARISSTGNWTDRTRGKPGYIDTAGWCFRRGGILKSKIRVRLKMLRRWTGWALTIGAT